MVLNEDTVIGYFQLIMIIFTLLITLIFFEEIPKNDRENFNNYNSLKSLENKNDGDYY